MTYINTCVKITLVLIRNLLFSFVLNAQLVDIAS